MSKDKKQVTIGNELVTDVTTGTQEPTDTEMDENALKDGDDRMERIREQIAAIRGTDPVARNQAYIDVFREYDALINFILNKHFATYKSGYYEDLHSCGKVGLMRALQKYDPDASKPSTYFSMEIKHEMYVFITKEIYHTTPYHARDLFKVLRYIQITETKTGITPTEEDIALHTKLPMQSVEKALKIRTMGDMQYYDSEQVLDTLIKSYARSTEEQAIENERMERLYAALGTLSWEEQQVICRTHGLAGYPIQNHATISAETGIPSDQIRKISTSGMKSLKNLIRKTSLYHDAVGATAANVMSEKIAVTPSTRVVEDLIGEMMPEEDGLMLIDPED